MSVKNDLTSGEQIGIVISTAL